MTLASGVLVNQNVRLTRLLGQGGMGAVWLADHLTLRTQVAVKFILEGYSTDPEILERFSREATSAAQIKSPHVVQVFDHGVFSGLPYIVMEFLDGEDLAARIARAPLALGELVPILQQMSKALTQAHALGIVHRDIKPANVYLTAAGDDLLVKLLDFGIAKSTRGGDDPTYKKTQTGQLVGTPCYMSPEQVFSRGALDARVDLWALSVLVYEAVTGVVPFTGTTLGDVYLAINSGTFQAPGSVDRSFPSALDGWFKRAFAQDPAARFGSARELCDTFVAIAARAPAARRSAPAGPPVTASSVMTTAPLGARHATFGGMVTPRTRRRRRQKGGLAIGLGALVGVVGMSAVVLLGRAPPTTTSSVSASTSSASASAAPAVPGAEARPMTTVSAQPPEVVPAPEETAAPIPSTASSTTLHPSKVKAAATAHPATSATPPDTPKRHDHGF